MRRECDDVVVMGLDEVDVVGIVLLVVLQHVSRDDISSSDDSMTNPPPSVILILIRSKLPMLYTPPHKHCASTCPVSTSTFLSLFRAFFLSFLLLLLLFSLSPSCFFISMVMGIDLMVARVWIWQKLIWRC